MRVRRPWGIKHVHELATSASAYDAFVAHLVATKEKGDHERARVISLLRVLGGTEFERFAVITDAYYLPRETGWCAGPKTMQATNRLLLKYVALLLQR